ncbi:hypothetical protein K443DRAFT_13700 [Laccaria amethystina LaAM-08-1]|uniref:KOW domain-containing protein n=1 Tax=Laccaria amethystina LaAM-08-1 TaxID=1095629 RepID=A0A0C9X7A4_9AGAR|nr:hypothetical protein K443DRAFT_13700 [Laccaria amethystina LaAM-08-1]
MFPSNDKVRHVQDLQGLPPSPQIMTVQADICLRALSFGSAPTPPAFDDGLIGRRFTGSATWRSGLSSKASRSYSGLFVVIPQKRSVKESNFKRFVEVGRVVLLKPGPFSGKIAVIAEIIDYNRAIIDAATTGVPRQSYPTSTSPSLPSNSQASPEEMDNSSWAQKRDAVQKRRALTDFGRCSIMLACFLAPRGSSPFADFAVKRIGNLNARSIFPARQPLFVRSTTNGGGVFVVGLRSPDIPYSPYAQLTRLWNMSKLETSNNVFGTKNDGT